MDLDGFLKVKGTSLDEVTERATAAAAVAPGDVLVLCGSVVEGLGNERSDLDLLLVTRRPGVAPESLVAAGSCLVDLRVLPHAELEDLLRRFQQWSRAPRRPRSAMSFDAEERKLLHRLHGGRALHGAVDLRRLQEAIPAVDLARHALDCARYLAGTFQIDLAGFRGASDPYSMLFAAQELLGHSMDALLAAHGHTNPNPKWRMRQLSSLPGTWELRMPGRDTGRSARDLYVSLRREPDGRDPLAVLHHSLRIAALSRRILGSVEYQLFEPADSPPLPGAGDGEDSGERPLPHLDLDVVLRYEDSGFVLLRPNAPGHSFRLTPAQFSVLSLFDGVTTREYAIRYAEETAGQRGAAHLVASLHALVRHGHFEASSIVDESALEDVLRRPRPTAVARDS